VRYRSLNENNKVALVYVKYKERKQLNKNTIYIMKKKQYVIVI